MYCIKRIEKFLQKHKDYLYEQNKEQYFNCKCTGPFVSSIILLILVFASYLIFRSPVVAKLKEAIFRLLAVMLGFLFAAARSWIKDWRAIENGKNVTKPRIDMIWPYSVNYPILLSSIYILGSYFLDKKSYPDCVIWTILFLLAYFVDIVWEEIKGLLRGLLKVK